MDKEIQANQWWLDMWHKRTSPLDPSSPNQFWEKEKEREEKESFVERESVHLLSKIPGDRTIKSRRAKRQSFPPLQELRLGIGFVEFRQTPGGRGLLLLGLFLS